MFLLRHLVFNTHSSIRSQIQAATRAGRNEQAENLWQSLANHYPDQITPQDLINWAGSSLRANHPTAALKILNKWKVTPNPRQPEGWLLLLDLYRNLGDMDQLNLLVAEILSSSPPALSPQVLSTATLALLTDLDQAEVRLRLQQWSNAEPNSPLAPAALLFRYADNPLPDDPPRDSRIAQAEALVAAHPDSIPALHAAIVTFFNSGLYDQAAALLGLWPESNRQGSLWNRLHGRRLQDLEKNDTQAASAYQQTLAIYPHDWKTRYRLSRALAASGQLADARIQATQMSLVRESLEPAPLEKILKTALSNSQKSNPDALIALLHQIGLTQLAKAWETAQHDAALFNLNR